MYFLGVLFHYKMAVRIQYASNLLMDKIRYGISPIHPAGDVLILAGGTGLLSNMRVQQFYEWCSYHFRETYTLLEDSEERKLGSLLKNVHVLNEDYHILPQTGHIVSGKLGYDYADIHVGNTMAGKGRLLHIHKQGRFDIHLDNGVLHTANSAKSNAYNPRRMLYLDNDDHIQHLQ